MAIGSTPLIGRNSPPKDSSPTHSYSLRLAIGIWPEAAKTPKAMAKSKRPPSLGKSAGARLTVMRWAGNSKREFNIAPRTLSLLSFTAVSGNPTILSAGKPFAT